MFRKIKHTRIFKNFNLKELSTIRIGGKAKYYIECFKETSLKKVITICLKHHLKYKIIGGGSNLLFDDLGYNGAIIKYTNNFTKITNNILTASAGCKLCDLIQLSKQHNLSGLEYFVGIPCNLGGAVFNNIGTNNQEISNLIIKIKYYKINIKNNKIKINKILYKPLKNSFSYRKNNFLNKFDILLEISLFLNKLNKNIIENNIKNYYLKKSSTQPLNAFNIGSIFKRDKFFFPAKIIDELGLKGYLVGGAQISTKHAGFIINLNNASSQNVLDLINIIKTKVKQNFNLDLELEIEHVY